ncbi:MAG TPA: cystathionine gamma-lyase [Mycobacteriales bacterium]|nr:cystathionine gamma-lyase [Mycobacteriales bacterium]
MTPAPGSVPDPSSGAADRPAGPVGPAGGPGGPVPVPRYRDGTRTVHAGLPPAERGAPFLPGPTFAATYHLGGPGDGTDSYGRNDNPTWRRYEAALGELEGGSAVVFSSGMAAVSAVLLSLLAPGQALVLPADGYYVARALAREHLAARGVALREVPTGRPLSESDIADAALVLLETPSNPGLDVADIAAAVDIAHRHGVPIAVDNTTATPLGQRPLEFGADYSISSGTKALTGHGDLLLGHVAVTDPGRLTALRSWRLSTGAIPGPFETWLAHRSLATLDLRLARQAANALALATLLSERPEVTGLRYPGLPTDPAHALASRQMHRFGGVLSFELASAEAVERFLGTARLVLAATSFGGLHTTADRRAQWGGDIVPAGFVRLSAGCEDTADLVDDVTRALAGLPLR